MGEFASLSKMVKQFFYSSKIREQGNGRIHDCDSVHSLNGGHVVTVCPKSSIKNSRLQFIALLTSGSSREIMTLLVPFHFACKSIKPISTAFTRTTQLGVGITCFTTLCWCSAVPGISLQFLTNPWSVLVLREDMQHTYPRQCSWLHPTHHSDHLSQ